jgi:2'-hydroxyisoflavone reductase
VTDLTKVAVMKLLVLGGTVFLGRHVVETALARGHEVTLFNRGRTRPELFPGVERLTGDRDGGLDALRGRAWDAVVDPSGYVPRVVGQTADVLRDAAGTYVFISSASVYPLRSEDKSETGPVLPLEDPTTEDIRANYGALKAACEDLLTGCFGERALIVRSGLIVGPHDPSGRFTYWALRLGRGGEVLGPGDPDRPMQFIDARDQAAWILDMAEAGRGGTFNVTGPADELPFASLLARAEGPVTWVADEFLQEQGVQAYTEMPLWVPPSVGSLHVPIDRALAAGLRFRDVDETIRDVQGWVESDADAPRGSAITAEREVELLELWHARR